VKGGGGFLRCFLKKQSLSTRKEFAKNKRRYCMKGKYLVSMTVILVVAVFLAVSCGGGDEKAGLPDTEQGIEATQEVKSTGKMNDDLAVELMAYQIYLHHKYIGSDPKKAGDPANLAKMVEEIENICKKSGVTSEELGIYTDKLEAENFEHYRELIMKANDRAEELKKGSK
jgi:hypothetical protein